MVKRLVFLAFSSCLALAAFAQEPIRLEAGLVISSSVTIAPGEYKIPGDSLGAIRIRGRDITIDFNGAILDGASADLTPDLFDGVGIYVDSSSNVTILNAVVRGFKVGLLGHDAPNLTISRGDFSYNFRQRLKSTIEREHLDDWMSYHINEQDEWLRYGAAIYLNRCDRAVVEGVRVTGGQNGVMLTNVDHGSIRNNAITFNSGIGVGLYRSSHNTILYNRLDWNVRGYSHGVYYRGQDSAAILMYEQSSNNTVAYNSATHSGDGLFLWAGQTTMDDGSGGCNDNLIVGNDFSFAPTNGIEVTFSRNVILGNRLEGCWHGIWGGYSYDTVVARNTFVDNVEHIAIEHGQDITISNNTFSGGAIGLNAWERARQPADWGYALNRDVRSRDYTIESNVFDRVAVPLRVLDTESVRIVDNRFGGRFDSLDFRGTQVLRFDGNGFADYENERSVPVSGADIDFQASRFGDTLDPALEDALAGIPDWPSDLPRGRRYMLIDEWGPYDFRSPVLWPRTPRSAIRQTFDIYGPEGAWKIVRTSGVDSISATGGTIPDSMVVWRQSGPVVDVRLDLEFSGNEAVDRFGNVNPAGSPVVYSYAHFFAQIDWTVDFYAYDASTDPRERYEGFRELISGTPVFTDHTTDLGYQWYGSPGSGVPPDHFATVAEGKFTVPPGAYRLDLTSDDGVRVWLDGALIHDDWTYHAPKLVQIDLELGGAHAIRIEHFEIDGYATLGAFLNKVTGRE